MWPHLSERLGLRQAVRHDDVVEDGAGLDLPQLKAQELEVGEGVQRLVLLELGVVDQGRLPDALVLGVLDLLGLPLACAAG